MRPLEIALLAEGIYGKNLAVSPSRIASKRKNLLLCWYLLENLGNW
jgi:hypothetical protein